MGRRGNGEGSIHQRDDGRWQAIITVDGKRKYFYGKTRADVLDRLDQAKHDVRSGLPMLDERQTLEQYLGAWYETIRPRVAPSSYRKYGDYVRHITEALGTVPLAKLTAQQLQLFYARKLSEGLSGRYINYMHLMLKQALNEALAMNLVQRNVCTMVKPPRPVRHETHPLDLAQVRRFLEAVQGDRLEALYILALSTGMREGELLALRWQDVDLAHRTVSVRQSIHETAEGFTIGQTKTRYSRRTIGLTDLAIDALGRHWQTQQVEQSQGMPYDATLDLVFVNQYGHFIYPRALGSDYFKRHLRNAGLSDVFRFHDLRHTAATLLLAAGVNVKVVSEMLGHSNVSITLNIYAHVLPHMQQSAVDTMASLLESHEPRKIAPALG